MNAALQRRFSPILEEKGLTMAIVCLCLEIGGNVVNLKILPAVRNSSSNILECNCYLQLDSQTSEATLKVKHGASDFGGRLHFIAEVDEGWVGARG